MKTLITLSALLASVSMSYGQATVIEFGPGAQTDVTSLKTSLEKLLEKADTQLEKLDEQLKRTGDYLATNRDSVITAQDAIAQAKDMGAPKSNAELAAIRAAAKGEDVFDASKNVEGVFTAVSQTYQKRVVNEDGSFKKDADGNYVTESATRDPKDYDMEAKRIADLREFYRVRDEAIAKQKSLEEARIDAHKDLLETEDAVETQRLTSLISSIDAEIIAVRQDIANASHELEVHEKAMMMQQLVEAKAKREETRRKSSTPEDIQKNIEKMKENLDKSLEERARGRLP